MDKVEDANGNVDDKSGAFTIPQGEFRDFDADNTKDAVNGNWNWERTKPDGAALFLENISATLSGDDSTQVVLGGSALYSLTVETRDVDSWRGSYTVEYGDQTSGSGTWFINRQ